MTGNLATLRFIPLFAVMLLWGAAAYADEAIASNPAAILPNAGSADGEQPMATVDGKNLIGREVTSARDEIVGEIDSVYVDAQGNVKQIIITGSGDRSVAIDWKDVMVSDNGKKIAVDVSKDQLTKMPEYSYARPEQQGTVFTDEANAADVP